MPYNDPLEYTDKNDVTTLYSRSLSKCYLRIQSVPQREHNIHHYKDQLLNAV
jgi:hypothetical protein